jgi:NADH-quinone oxidoreductase subunit J
MEIMSIQVLHFMFCFFLVSCAFCVGFSFNSVESVIFLILTFLNAAALLFLFNVDFLGVIFIIIYVGAVAVLFLFVIMMLNVKNDEIGRQNYYKNSVLYSFFYLVLITLIFNKFHSASYKFLYSREFSFLDFDYFNNIDVLGQVLFNYYIICFLFCGLALLIALVGSVVLTIRFNTNQRRQIIFRQLSRTDSFLTFFK